MSDRRVSLKVESSVITKGTTPTSLGHPFTDAGVPFIRAQNIVDKTVSVSADPLFISTETNKALKRSKILANDILISIAGTIGQAAIVPSDAEEMNCNQAVAIVRPSDNIDRRYLLHWLSSDDALSQMARGKVTGVISNLSLGEIGKLQILLPPLDEQKRIAGILDQADALRRLRTRTLDKLNTLGQAIFHEMFGASGDFENMLLSDVVYFQEGPGVRRWQFRDKGIKLVNVGNIVDGELNLGKTDRHLDESEVIEKYTHFLLNAEDFVVASSGATWGKIAEVEACHLPLCLNTSMIRFRPHSSEIRKCYIRAFVEMGSFRSQIDKLITGSAQPNFGPTHLKQINIPVPSKSLQGMFESRIEEINLGRKHLMESLKKEKNLFASLQYRAFCGEL